VSFLSINSYAVGTTLATKVYHKKLYVANFIPVFKISAPVLNHLATFATLPTFVHHFTAAFKPALAPFQRPKVNNQATSSTTETAHVAPLIHLSVVQSCHAIPFHVIDVQTS